LAHSTVGRYPQVFMVRCEGAETGRSRIAVWQLRQSKRTSPCSVLVACMAMPQSGQWRRDGRVVIARSMRGDEEGFFDSNQCGRKLWSRQCFRVATRMIYVKAGMAALRKMEGCGSPLRQLRSTAILNSPSSMRMGRTRWSFRAGASWAAGSRRRHAAASTCIPRIGVTGRHRLKRQLSLAAVRASREARSL